MSRFLTKQERKALEQELRLERYARFSDRIKCILLLDSGKTSESIAEYLFLSRNTVTNYYIFVVADNARYYRNRKVKAFLETSKVKIIFLPPYSPNLNLIERLWRFLKKIVLYNRYYERFADFKAAILSFFANIKQYRPELESLMKLKLALPTFEWVITSIKIT